MNNINVNDINALISQAENLFQFSQNILRSVEDLQGISGQISVAWQSDTVDKESYLKAINESLTKATTLAEAVRQLSVKLNNYAQKQLTTSNNGSSN